MTDQQRLNKALGAITLACWAKASGLAREEATQLHRLLGATSLPTSVDQAWVQLEEATLAIRRGRHGPG